LISTSSDALNVVTGYTELSAIPFSSSDTNLKNGLDILKRVIQRTPLTTDVYAKSVSAMSNLVSRKIDLYNT